MLKLAGDEIDFDHALAHLTDYAGAVPDTIKYYDFGGDLDRTPSPSDGVDMADIARLVVINAELRANDVRALLDPVEPGLWERVPHQARFEALPDNPLSHPTYEGLLALYRAYDDRDGLGDTKVSKLLHVKRPALVPILDSVALRAYEKHAQALAAEFGQGKALYFAAMWRDARTNSVMVARLAKELRALGGNAVHLGALSPLRLHDVLVWSHFRRVCTISD